jgi:hypothetical protein
VGAPEALPEITKTNINYEKLQKQPKPPQLLKTTKI